jgi:anti-sigma28 factor (negative regulator of flagellin synthesis)
MRIATEHVGSLLGSRLEKLQGSKQSAVAAKTDSAQPDCAVFSPLAEDLRAGLAAAREATTTDSARLASLAIRVRTGTYNPSSEAVADAMIQDLKGG